jgi:hypothetical protein
MVETVKPLPPLMRFEHYPQVLGRKDTIFDQIYQRIGMRRLLLSTSGHINAGAPEMEDDAQSGFAEVLGMPVYSVGYDPAEAGGREDIPAVMNNHQISTTGDAKVVTFMNEMQHKYGQKSLAYVRYVRSYRTLGRY